MMGLRTRLYARLATRFELSTHLRTVVVNRAADLLTNNSVQCFAPSAHVPRHGSTTMRICRQVNRNTDVLKTDSYPP